MPDNDTPHIHRETDAPDEDLDRQESRLNVAAEEAGKNPGADPEDFTVGGGEESPEAEQEDPPPTEPAANDTF